MVGEGEREKTHRERRKARPRQREGEIIEEQQKEGVRGKREIMTS